MQVTVDEQEAIMWLVKAVDPEVKIRSFKLVPGELAWGVWVHGCTG
jgi:hypothetical protein